jgi:Tol biopolymer transport system component
MRFLPHTLRLRAFAAALFAAPLALVGCGPAAQAPPPDSLVERDAAAYDPATDSLRFPGEVHLRNVRQLTDGGNNAEAYWSFDGEHLIFQSDYEGINDQGCDQQYVMRADGQPLETGEQYRLVSTGEGRTTCGYYLPDGRVLFASTHGGGPECPTPSPRGGAYVWDIYDSYDIYVADADGTNIQPLITSDGYDAEPTVSPDGRFVIFTSTRDGDLDIYRYELATGETIRITDTVGYDGGAFFSPDSERIVWRASRPTGADAERYQQLLEGGQVEPGALDIYVADADGSNVRRVTNLPGANWAPFFHPDGERILFSSNYHTMDEGGRVFDLFMVDGDGSNLKQITHSGTFDAFPMFSFDGTQLVFSSNRRVDRQPSRDTNVFVADWVDEPTAEDVNFQDVTAP